MISIRFYLFSLILLVITILSLVTTMYQFLSITLFATLLSMLLLKMGNGIVLRESTALLYVLTCILMPVIGYNFYNINNPLSRLWIKYMAVPENVYFSYTLPAISLFSFILTFPLKSSHSDEGNYIKLAISRIRAKLESIDNIGIIIACIGVLSSFLQSYATIGLQFFINLFYFASFPGMLYVYYSPNFRFKRLMLILFLLFLFNNALNSGMFTILAYMGITIFSFLILGKKQGFLKKLLILLAAISFVIILQNTKIAYRKTIWQGSYVENKIALFGEIFLDNLSKGKLLIEEESFFVIYTRINQGNNVALVMKRIPGMVPFDNGSQIVLASAAAFVPRFLWPDKPEAGGAYNMKKYAGITLQAGWSANIGPLGEAYANFGVAGGIIFMAFIALFIRLAYVKVFKISKKYPLILLWIPFLFYQITYSAETDTLQILNSLLKSSFFLWLFFTLYPKILASGKKIIKPKISHTRYA